MGRKKGKQRNVVLPQGTEIEYGTFIEEMSVAFWSLKCEQGRADWSGFSLKVKDKGKLEVVYLSSLLWRGSLEDTSTRTQDFYATDCCRQDYVCLRLCQQVPYC